MICVSEIQTVAPSQFQTDLQKSVYQVLDVLQIPYERVDTDEVITMEDCVAVNKKLNMNMVKTLFLCNRQQTEFYLFVTVGDKPFRSKDFSNALDVARVYSVLCWKPQGMSRLFLTRLLCPKNGMGAVMELRLDI